MKRGEAQMYLSRDCPEAAEFGLIAEQLLAQTRSSRTTVRLCRSDGAVALVAEARREGVPSMSEIRTKGIRVAGTYTYLETTQEILVQNDCRTGEPSPPPSLIEELKVYAQMLAPVVIGGVMVATISVHQQDETRGWARSDIDYLAEAQGQVQRVLETRAQTSGGDRQ